MSKITAMYIRLSMEDEDVSLNQKEESNSVSSQRELLESFIGNHSELKDTKVQEYCDDGFTGTKFERPGYMKLMEDVRADKISCIVVKDLSRLGRDYIEVGSLLEQILPLYQVRVIAVNDKLTREEYVKRSKAMVEQIDELHQKIEQLKSELPTEDNSAGKFETQLENIINMESFDREKIQKVIKKVIINGEDNIEIVWNTDDLFFK